jgi:molybdate transport system regulatory protein
VISVKKGDVMSLIKVKVSKPVEMGSVITTESLDELQIKEGDEIELVIKAINVLPVKYE